MAEPLIFEISRPGREGVPARGCDVPRDAHPGRLCARRPWTCPEVAEVDVVRHYVHLSQMNYSVDTGLYPLGSCTMKYNPKVNEVAARLPGLRRSCIRCRTPPPSQGAMALMYALQEMLAEIGGFHAVSLQPSAGRAGRADRHPDHAHVPRRARPDREANRILVPDSAHGTNPASTTMAGLEVVEIPSDARGNVDLIHAAGAAWTTRVAGLMLTNPNTLGLFEENLLEVTRLVHEAGGLVYGDGANFNAILGVAKPGQMGIDVMHFNLHKTFSTPHGGGGPGSGAVGVAERLVGLPARARRGDERATADERLATQWRDPAQDRSAG